MNFYLLFLTWRFFSDELAIEIWPPKVMTAFRHFDMSEGVFMCSIAVE
jgi:hypothetical protein